MNAPVGWADVATRRDLDQLAVATKRDLDHLETVLRSDMEGLESRVEAKLESALHAQSLRFMAFVTTVAGIALAVGKFA
jgi:hypothetical protein